jgi:hypothetical protein
MEALVNLFAQYFGIDPAVLFAAINAQQASEDNRVVSDNVTLDSSDAADDESDEYVNGVYVGDNDSSDHDESNEYANGVYDGSAVVRSSAGYSEISDDRNDQYRFGLSGSELADGDLVDAGEQIVAKYELGRRGWEFDRLDSDESLAVQVFNNEAFIIETEYERPGKVEFKIFSDLDGDQVWTEVVEGEAYSSSTSIDLVGLVNAGVIDPAMLLG